MRISQNINDLQATITMIVEKTDYLPAVKKILKERRNTSDFKGFRPGMAPMSLVEKLHGKTILIDELQKLISKSLDNYIKENNLQLLGGPLPHQEEYNMIEWENCGDMKFTFDIGLTPEFEITFTEKDKIPYYKIIVTEEDIAEYKKETLYRHGEMIDKETSEKDDSLIVTLTQDERVFEDVYLSLEGVKDIHLREPFIGKKIDDEFEADLKQSFTNETELAAVLGIEEKELAGIKPVFKVKITGIKHFSPAELNQEFYDTMFGEDVVKSEEEFNEKVKDYLHKKYERHSESRFAVDARNEALRKAQFKLPEDFLKRWMLHISKEEIAEEQIDATFNTFIVNVRWKLISTYLMKEYKLHVTEEEIATEARQTVRRQFFMYGWKDIDEDHLDDYVNYVLQNEEPYNNFYETVAARKVTACIKSAVELDEKEVTKETFQELN